MSNRKPDFLKLVDEKNKTFLWGGTAKIAHHSIIADYSEGGIKYKDLACLITSVNVKFLFNRNNEDDKNSFVLFKINSTNENYQTKYFNKSMNILDCKLKIPRKTLWQGHGFYYEVLKGFEKLLDSLPRSVEQLLSMPLWFNKFMDTSFDETISKAGYNYIKDLFPLGKLLEINTIETFNLNLLEKHKLITLIRNVPRPWSDYIHSQVAKDIVIYPFQSVNVNGQDMPLKNPDSKVIYNILVRDKIRMPVGMINWCLDLELSDLQIRTAFTFAHNCSSSTFDRMFQYKIATQILPTNDYLTRYRVKETSVCQKCELEFDSIEHSLYSCSEIVHIIATFIKFLTDECGVTIHIGLIQYLFGISGSKYLGLNHVLLELKKAIFYSWDSNIENNAFCQQVKTNIKKIIIKEKSSMLKNNQYEEFDTKWDKFVSIYDFRGPDLQ